METQDALDRGIAAHGGLATWQSHGGARFDIESGGSAMTNVVDLRSRRALASGESFEIGFDGEDVWIMPGLDAFQGSPRFYNGLDFYFFAMPFVLADPGTRREDLGRVSVGEEEFDAVRVSFDDGVGDSPGDFYVAHFDPATHRLRFLLYTVTFFSGEPDEKYNARVYEEWQEAGGLTVPRKASSYEWIAGEGRLGEKHGEATYGNVLLTPEPPDAMLFEMPEGAEIDAPQPSNDT